MRPILFIAGLGILGYVMYSLYKNKALVADIVSSTDDLTTEDYARYNDEKQLASIYPAFLAGGPAVAIYNNMAAKYKAKYGYDYQP